MLALCTLSAAFVVPTPLAHSAVPMPRAPTHQIRMVDIPRITLPSAIGDCARYTPRIPRASVRREAVSRN
jgi:hypothetical protein